MISMVNILKSILNFLLSRKSESKTVHDTVYETIKSFGEQGCISDEVLKRNSAIRYSSITARYNELIKEQLVELTGEYRPGLSGRAQRVMRVKA
jgi:hypothetical protein